MQKKERKLSRKEQQRKKNFDAICETMIANGFNGGGCGRECPGYPGNGSFYGTGAMDVPPDRPQ